MTHVELGGGGPTPQPCPHTDMHIQTDGDHTMHVACGNTLRDHTLENTSVVKFTVLLSSGVHTYDVVPHPLFPRVMVVFSDRKLNM